MSDLPSPEAFIRVDAAMAELGIDVAEAASSPAIGAFAEMMLRIEQSKIEREQQGEQ